MTKPTTQKKFVSDVTAKEAEAVTKQENKEVKKALEGEVTDPKPTADDHPSAFPGGTEVESSVAVTDNASIATGIIAGVSTEQLTQALEMQTAHRKLVADFIKKHLKKGVDYLRIHVVRGCQTEERARGSCRNMGHYSKDILAKPGQEKIFSLFGLTGKLTKDVETLEMLGNPKGTVALKCDVYRGDLWVTEGRGAATVGDNRRDANATIKIAEKRARMDAALSLGFSEYFAQDLDDPDYQNQKRMAEEQAANQAPPDDGTGLPPRPANAPIDEQERTTLAKWMLKRGFDTPEEQLELLKVNGITEPGKMTSSQCREMIRKLKIQAFAAPAKTENPDAVEENIDAVDVEAELTAAAEGIEKQPPIPEPSEPEIDDDFKAHTEEMFNKIPFNAQGKQWFMRYVNGKAWATFDKFTDEHWKKALDMCEAIAEGHFTPEDHHIQGYVPDSPEPTPKPKPVPEDQEDADPAKDS